MRVLSRYVRWQVLPMMCAIGALGIVACGSDESDDAEGGAATKPKVAKIVAGTSPFDAFAAMQIGVDKGIFTKHGIDLEMMELRQSADSVPNIISGRAQVGTLTLPALQQAISEGLPLKIVAPVLSQDAEANRVFVKSDSKLRSISDLRGKKVGSTALTSHATAGLLKIFEENGLSKEDVKLVAVPAAEGVAALENGTVDAGQVLQPFATQQADKIRPIVPNMLAPFGDPPTIAGYWIMTDKFIAENPDAVRRFVDAMQEANTLAGGDDELVRDAVIKVAGTPPDLAEKLPLPVFGTDFKFDQANRMVQLMEEEGFLKDVVDFNELVAEPAKEAAAAG
jgi:NitT/TauT family transport system substrate-binding protein